MSANIPAELRDLADKLEGSGSAGAVLCIQAAFEIERLAQLVKDYRIEVRELQRGGMSWEDATGSRPE